MAISNQMEVEKVGRQLQYALIKQGFVGIMQFLPHISGVDTHLHQSATIAPYMKAVSDSARNGSFEIALHVILDLIEEIIVDTGWSIQRDGPSVDPMSVKIACNPDVEPTLLLESFILLTDICEQNWALSIGLYLGKSEEEASRLTIAQAGLRLFRRAQDQPKPLENELAQKLMVVMCKLCPPILWRLKPRGTMFVNDELSVTNQMLLWGSTFRMIQFVMLRNGNTSFRDLHQRVMKHCFSPSTPAAGLDDTSRSELLASVYLDPKNPLRVLQEIQDYLIDLKNPLYFNSLASLYGISIDNWVSNGFCYTLENPENLAVLRSLVNQLTVFLKQKSPFIDYKDVQFHTILFRLSILLDDDEIIASTTKYVQYYRGRLLKEETEYKYPALGFFSQVAWSIFNTKKWGPPSKHIDKLVDTLVETLPDIDLCADYFYHDIDFCARHLAWLPAYHSACAMLDTDRYFKHYFEDLESQSPVALLSAMIAFTNKLSPDFTLSEEVFCSHNSMVLKVITFCGEKALVPGQGQLLYDAGFTIGLIYLFRSADHVKYLSNESILEFCVMVLETLKTRRPNSRGRAVAAAIHLFMHSSQDSLDVMIKTRLLLNDILKSAENVLKDIECVNDSDNTFNMDLIHDIMKTRLHVSKRILALDPTKFEMDEKLETILRNAIIINICSADREISVRAVECLRILSEEVNAWAECKLPAPTTPFIQETFFLQGIWQVMIDNAPTAGSNSVTMRHLIGKVFDKFPDPPAIPGITQLISCGTELYRKIETDHERKLNPTVRKSLMNVMALVCSCARVLGDSANYDHRAIARSHVYHMSVNLTSIYPPVRDAALATLRSEVIINPMHGVTILMSVKEGFIAPLHAQAAQPKDMKLAFYKGLSLFTSELGRLFGLAGTAETPVRCDLGRLATMVFELPRHMYHNYGPALAKPFFILINNLVHAENLHISSKFDVFYVIVTVIFEELNKYPDHSCLTLISDSMCDLLDDYTLYASHNGRNLVMDSRYSAFRMMISTMARYLTSKDREVCRNFESAIEKLCIANQEMAIVYFEDAEPASNPRLRAALYQSFSNIFSGDVEPDNKEQEDLINLLIKDMTLLEAMCDICPQEEARELATIISTLFTEYNHGNALVKWAFQRDLDAASTPEEVMRKNTIYVQIVLQVFYANLKPKYHQLIRQLIREVYDNPYIFLSMTDPLSEGCKKAVDTCINVFQPCMDNPEVYMGDTALKITVDVVEMTEEQFPGTSTLVFRNLFFLRITCPMVVQPQTFGITAHTPEGMIREGLVHWAKFVQQIDFRNPNIEIETKRASVVIIEHFKHQMIAAATRETAFGGFDVSLFSSKAIERAFYDLKQFLYRHSRELKACLYICSGDTQSVGGDSSRSLRGSVSSCSTVDEPHNQVYNEFIELMHRIGRPAMSILNRKRQHSSRSYTRKNSLAPWGEGERKCMYHTVFDGYPAVVFDTDVSSLSTMPDMTAYYREMIPMVQKKPTDGSAERYYGIIDNTSTARATEESLDFRAAFNKIYAENGCYWTHIISLNCSFAFFQHIFTVSREGITVVGDGNLNQEYMTTEDMKAYDLTQVGLSETTLMIIRDIRKSEKFENVSLEYCGVTFGFTVYVGDQFIHVIGDCKSCDTFSFDCIRFINGAIHLKKQTKNFFITFIVKLSQSSSIHKKLWTIFNTSRNNTRQISQQPILEVEARQFYSYLLCQSMFDLCGDCEVMRYFAHNLLPSIINKFQLDTPGLDISLQTSSHQPARVAQISKTLALAHPTLVLEFLQSFIALCGHRGRIDYAVIEFISPWFQQLPVLLSQAVNTETKKEYQYKLELLTRSLWSLHDTLSETDPASRQLVITYLWPYMMDTTLAPITFEVYLSCNTFRIDILQEKEGSAVYPIPMSSNVIKYITNLVLDLMSESGAPNPKDVPRWSDTKRWDRVKIILLTFSKCIFSGPEQILEVLPELIVSLFLFSAVGPHYLRQNMHLMLNNIVSQCIVMNGISVFAQDQLKKLKSAINSERGLVLFGVHTSLSDENFDVFDGMSFSEAAKLANYLNEFMTTILGPEKLSSVRSTILKRLYDSTEKGCIAFSRRAYYGILAFTSSKLTANQIFFHFKFCLGALHIYLKIPDHCKDRYIQDAIQSYQQHCDRLLIWLDDRSVSRYLWVSIGLQSLMIGPALSGLVKNVTTCLRIYQMRGLHLNGHDDLLYGVSGDFIRAWHERHADHVQQIPHPSSHFAARITYPLIPSFTSSVSRPAALDVCEAWLNILQTDKEIGSTLELKLLYFVFVPEQRLLASCNLFGVYTDDVKSSDISTELVHKLANEISSDYTHGVVALLSVCQALLGESLPGASFRFSSLLCKITNPKVVIDLKPILYPLCLSMVPLLEHENHNLTLDLANSITLLSKQKETTFEESLARVQGAIATVGRPKDVDDDFVLHPPVIYGSAEARVRIAIDLLSSVILHQSEVIGVKTDNFESMIADVKQKAGWDSSQTP